MTFEAVFLADATGDAARARLLEMAASGGVERDLPAKVALRLLQGRRVGLATGFIADALDCLPDAMLEVAGLAVMAGPQAADPDTVGHTLPLLFRHLDSLADGLHEAALAEIAKALAGAPDGLAAHLAAHLDGLAESRSFLCALLMSAVMEGAEEAGAEARRRLSALPAPGHGAITCLAKALIANGDLEAAADILASAAAVPEAHRGAGTLAATLFCLGREAEARDMLARSLAHLGDDWKEAKRRFNEAWAAQLAEALTEGTLDGGEADRLGAAATYTREDRWRSFWDDHRESCGPENRMRTVAGYTNALMFGEAEALLDQETGLTKLVNYGTLCGLLEDGLAARRPDLTVAGYDVCPNATALNRQTYARPNLHFSDDFDGLLGALESEDGDSLLVHCRTFDVMLPGAVRAAYRACRERGVRYILSAEYFSVCWDSLDWPRFTPDGPPTVQWDGVVMVHDLPRYVEEAGYRVMRDSFHPLPLFASGTAEGLQPAQLIRLILAERAP